MRAHRRLPGRRGASPRIVDRLAGVYVPADLIVISVLGASRWRRARRSGSVGVHRDAVLLDEERGVAGEELEQDGLPA